MQVLAQVFSDLPVKDLDRATLLKAHRAYVAMQIAADPVSEFDDHPVEARHERRLPAPARPDNSLPRLVRRTMPPHIKQAAKQQHICPACLRRIASQLAQAEAGGALREVREQVWRMYGGRMKITYRREFADGDYTTIPRFDECVNEIQLSHPWVRDADHLFEILKQPAQKLTPQWDEALRLLTPSPQPAESGLCF